MQSLLSVSAYSLQLNSYDPDSQCRCAAAKASSSSESCCSKTRHSLGSPSQDCARCTHGSSVSAYSLLLVGVVASNETFIDEIRTTKGPSKVIAAQPEPASLRTCVALVSEGARASFQTPSAVQVAARASNIATLDGIVPAKALLARGNSPAAKKR